MEFRQGTIDDLNNICKLITAAINTMEEKGIHQWDAIYPTKEDFANDIINDTLYTVTEGAQLIAIYTINTEYNPEYLNTKWTYNGEMTCIIHRLCVSPEVQNRGIGKIVLNHIENQLQNIGVESVRLDVFSENPYAIRLYEKVAM